MKPYPWISGLKSTSDFDAKLLRRVARFMKLDALFSRYRSKNHSQPFTGVANVELDEVTLVSASGIVSSHDAPHPCV